MFAIRDVNTRKLLKHYVYKTASARIEVYDVIKITFRTFHWYSYCYADVPRPSRFTCEGLARETRGNKRVCLVSVDDMEDVNKLFRSTDGHEVTLWCMGCTKKQKGKRAISDVDSNDTSSESERPAKKSRKKKVTTCRKAGEGG